MSRARFLSGAFAPVIGIVLGVSGCNETPNSGDENDLKAKNAAVSAVSGVSEKEFLLDGKKVTGSFKGQEKLLLRVGTKDEGHYYICEVIPYSYRSEVWESPIPREIYLDYQEIREEEHTEYATAGCRTGYIIGINMDQNVSESNSFLPREVMDEFAARIKSGLPGASSGEPELVVPEEPGL